MGRNSRASCGYYYGGFHGLLRLNAYGKLGISHAYDVSRSVWDGVLDHRVATVCGILFKYEYTKARYLYK